MPALAGVAAALLPFRTWGDPAGPETRFVLREEPAPYVRARPALPARAHARFLPATVVAGDVLLGRLGAARQALVTPLAKAAALVVAHRAWVVCGFNLQGDYAREVLHRDGRWLRALARRHHDEHAARAAAGMEAAPAATAASGRNTTAAIAAAGRTAAEDDAAGEDHVLVVQTMPPDVKLAFETAFELHRCLAGHEVGTSEFVEALAGEAASAGCTPPDDFVPRFRRRASTRVHAAGMARRPAAAVTDRSMVPALQTPALRQALRRLAEFDRQRTRLERLDAKLAVLEKRRQGEAEHTPTAPRRGQTTALGGVSPTRRRDIRRLARVLQSLLALENGLEIAMGDLLLELHEHRAWHILGVTGLEAYAAMRLGVGSSTARRRVALARALRRLYPVRVAYENGEIGLMEATWIARGLQRTTPDTATQQMWIAQAKTASHKRQRDEERCRERQRLQAVIDVADEMTPRVVGEWRARATAHFSPRPAAPTPMDDASWHAALRRVPGAARATVFALGAGLLDRLRRGGPCLDLHLALVLPESAAAQLLGCIEAARRRVTELAARSLPPEDDCRLTPAARLARTFVDRRQRVPNWAGLLALLEEYVWTQDRPRGRRERIAERDGYRCSAPGCTSRANLQVHHLRYRSRSGGNEPANLVLLCAFHHLQGEHGGLARCRGRAPLDIVWRLGCDDLDSWYRNEKRIRPRNSTRVGDGGD